MKIEKEQVEPAFVPVVITLESQEEVNKLFCVFNYTPINDADDLYQQLYIALDKHQISYHLHWPEIIKKIKNHPVSAL